MFFDEKISIDKKFAEWACSYSGFDGGNPGGSIWFCGIEYGGEEKEDDLRSEINKGPIEVPRFDNEKGRENALSGKIPLPQYFKGILKFYSSILGESPENYRKVYKNTSVLDKDSDIFSINLYPISFPQDNDDLWKEGHYKITGLPTKPLYRCWCQLNRFPKIKDWVDKNSPKIIIGSAKGHAQDFMMAFSGIENTLQEFTEHAVIDTKKKLYSSIINSEKTILFVVPFFGRGGLMSNKELGDFGKKINEFATTHFGSSWHKEYQFD